MYRLYFEIVRHQDISLRGFYRLLYVPGIRCNLKGELWLESSDERLYCVVAEGNKNEVTKFSNYLELTYECLGPIKNVKWDYNVKECCGRFQGKEKANCKHRRSTGLQCDCGPKESKPQEHVAALADGHRKDVADKDGGSGDSEVTGGDEGSEKQSPVMLREPAVKHQVPETEDLDGSDFEQSQALDVGEEVEEESDPDDAQTMYVRPEAGDEEESQALDVVSELEVQEVRGHRERAGNAQSRDLIDETSDEEEDQESISLLSRSGKRRRY